MNNLKMSMEALCEPDEKKIKEVCEQEAYIDFLNRQITDYLVKISELDLPIADAKILGGLFHVVNDIERIGDHAENLRKPQKSGWKNRSHSVRKPSARSGRWQRW